MKSRLMLTNSYPHLFVTFTWGSIHDGLPCAPKHFELSIQPRERAPCAFDDPDQKAESQRNLQPRPSLDTFESNPPSLVIAAVRFSTAGGIGSQAYDHYNRAMHVLQIPKKDAGISNSKLKPGELQGIELVVRKIGGKNK